MEWGNEGTEFFQKLTATYFDCIQSRLWSQCKGDVGGFQVDDDEGGVEEWGVSEGRVILGEEGVFIPVGNEVPVLR